LSGRRVSPARQHAILIAAHLGHRVCDPDARSDKQDAGKQSQPIVDHALPVVVRLAARVFFHALDWRILFRGRPHRRPAAAKRQDPAAIFVARGIRRHGFRF
jgi:hypothetical protein